MALCVDLGGTRRVFCEKDGEGTVRPATAPSRVMAAHTLPHPTNLQGVVGVVGVVGVLASGVAPWEVNQVV